MRFYHGTLLAALLPLVGHAQQPMRLEITIAGAAGDTILLASYYGNQLYYSDTAVADAQGLAVFARKSGYKPGLYAVLPGIGRIPVVLNEPLVKLSTTKADPMGQLRVVESAENQLHHVERRQAEALPEPQRGTKLMELAHGRPDAFASRLILMEQEPERMEVRRADGGIDSAATSDRARAHYWDHTDLQDDRIAHAPVFQNRLEALLATGIAQDANAITTYLDSLIARAGKAEEVKHLIISLAARKYMDQPTQGLGAVSVRLAQRHICTGNGGSPGIGWTPVDTWKKTCDKAAVKASLLVGSVSRDIVLADTTGTRWLSLHAMPQSCVVLVFWSPHCGHCKQAIPLLYEKYQQELKQLDVGVYAVAETLDKSLVTDWKAFVREKKLDWVNVAVPWPSYTDWRSKPALYTKGPTTRESLNYAETWEVSGTPQFYVLDKERRIVGKPMSINEIVSMAKAVQANAH